VKEFRIFDDMFSRFDSWHNIGVSRTDGRIC